MNYAELCAGVVSAIGNTFADEDLARFCKLVEQKVYNVVQIPELRKNMLGLLTTGNPYLTVPADYLYAYSLATIDPLTGEYAFLLNKDVNYLRDMFPVPSEQTRPRVYAQFDANTLMLAPTPDLQYEVELHFGYYPESIVTAGTSWLGDNFDSTLYNGMLVEAARFIKDEPDMIAIYDKQFDESMMLLKQLGDGKLRQDTFRTPQVKEAVR